MIVQYDKIGSNIEYCIMSKFCKILCNKMLINKRAFASHSRAMYHLSKEEYDKLYHSKEVTESMIECKICHKYFPPIVKQPFEPIPGKIKSWTPSNSKPH